ncbi:MAG: hypothetical protein ACR2QC_06040 [Gammaproteobacteria bacterium]
MKAALSGFSPVPFFAGFGLTAKIIAAAAFAVLAAGGAVYALAEKSYAPETIQFDGRTFHLLSERNGDTGELFSVLAPGEAQYTAAYIDTPEPPQDGRINLFYYQVLYAANPAPEFVRENGTYSSFARMDKDWGDINADNYFHYRIAGTKDGEFARLWAHENGYGEVIAQVTFCGESRPNAFICIGYKAPLGRRGAYLRAAEWKNDEGESHLERVYDLLAEYPLAHNEELLADMAEMVK